MTLQQDSTHPTGVSDDTPKGNSDVARARERKAHAAIQLRRDGYTWDQIAEALGYPTARAALVATELALESELKTDESQAFMRKMASDRLDRLLRGVWKKAIDPDSPEHLASVESARRLVKDHSDLMGYAAPKQAALDNPTMAKIQAWVDQVSHLEAPALEEQDIFELEEGPDGVHSVNEGSEG